MTQYETFADLLRTRNSCRAFKSDPVPEPIITQIVDAARHVPSWCNAQPWQLSITKGAATEAFRKLISDTAQTGTPPAPDLAWPTRYSGVYGDRRRACGFQLYDAVGIAKEDRAGRAHQMMRNYQLFDAPHVAIVHAPAELGPYGAMDTGGFVTAFILAATALGVATIPQAAIAAYAPQVRAHFGIKEDRIVLCAISFGYADADHPANGFRTSRAGADDIIAWHA
ncbi:MAG: nitroreductase [Pseudomonadota bacterium]